MKTLVGVQQSIAANAAEAVGVISCENLRSLVVSVRLKFDASATGDAVIQLFFSPDGKIWDAEPYAESTIPVSAGNVRQKSIPITPPEDGYIQVKVKNEDGSHTITDVQCWIVTGYWQSETK